MASTETNKVNRRSVTIEFDEEMYANLDDDQIIELEDDLINAISTAAYLSTGARVIR